MKTVLITGATSGIGKALTYLLAGTGQYQLILCGRRKDRLADIKKEIETQCRVTTLCFDVGNWDECNKQLNSLLNEWASIDILINNAGNAHGLAPINEGDLKDWNAMIDSNVKGVLHLCKWVSKGMVERKAGHIVNISSISGKEVYPQGNVYCATKFAVDALTQGMRMDLGQHNIKVSGISPGLVETEFSEVRFKGDKERAKNVYRGMQPLLPEDIAKTILFVISQPDHVNLADILILPKAQAASTQVVRNEL